MQAQPRPRQIMPWKRAQSAPARCLACRVKTAMAQTMAGSRQFAASGVRAWHTFAAMVLHCPCNHTPPPTFGTHMGRLVPVSSNLGTASGYVSFVRFGCHLCGHSLGFMCCRQRLPLGINWQVMLPVYMFPLMSARSCRVAPRRLRPGPPAGQKDSISCEPSC